MVSTNESDHEKIIRYEKLAKDMLTMLKDGSSNDVKIILDDGELSANKDVLAARCDYFAATFRYNNNNNKESGDIRIKDCSKKVMERIVEFLFTGVLKFKDLDLHSLMSLADQIRKLVLGVDLEKSVEKFLVEDLITTMIELPLGAAYFLQTVIKEQNLISSYHYAFNLNLETIQCVLATMIAFIIFCSDIDLEDVKKIVVDLPMTLFRGTLQPCHCFNCDDVMNRLTSKFSTLSIRQVKKRNFQFVAAWYEKNKDRCSKADR